MVGTILHKWLQLHHSRKLRVHLIFTDLTFISDNKQVYQGSTFLNRYISYNLKFKLMKLILLLFVLLATIMSDPLQTFYTPLNIPSGSRIYRVTKLQQITFTHSLTNSPNTWLEYSGLSMVVKLPFDQFVPISYTILIYSANICWMATRVAIDNKQIKLTYTGSQNTLLHNHNAYHEILLTKGDHSIRIDYRTDCNFNSINLGEINAVAVRADYMQVEAQKS